MASTENLIGLHCSIAGGVSNALDEAEKYKLTALQIFTANQRRWKAKDISEKEAEKWQEKMEKSTVKKSFSHCSYLINLGSSKPEVRKKSLVALEEEIQRCEKLSNLNFCVMHPGSAGDNSFEDTMEYIANGIMEVLEKTEGSKTIIALENTAGQGTSIGGPLENLEQLIDMCRGHNRLGVCIDTCHGFVQGYDLRDEEATSDFFDEVDRRFGELLVGLHLNDSKGELGTHLDRHEHIGNGKIGPDAFQHVIQRYPHLPKVLETPRSEEDDTRNLAILRKFAG